MLGQAGAIPAETSRKLIEEELVLINGKRWLRDSMLKSLPATASVYEARSNLVLVRTTTTLADAEQLLALLEQAYPNYEARFGPRKTARPLGLFVFLDQAAYTAWCNGSKHEGFARAAARIAANADSAGNFDLASWALYWFLSSTSNPKLSTRFEEWESFSLGSRGGGEEEATALFDRLFADAREELDGSFAEWLANPK
ncbi:MAG: hypothetical protein EXS13_10395 [Planctomycetes bacterium]|nr:hypothetical protein [Planctomycetota bacterium]